MAELVIKIPDKLVTDMLDAFGRPEKRDPHQVTNELPQRRPATLDEVAIDVQNWLRERVAAFEITKSEQAISTKHFNEWKAEN